MVAGKEITDADLERLVAPLNDAIAVGMGREMAGLQVPLRLETERWGEVVPDGRAPFSDPATLMRRAAMDGTTMAEWFRRESPSRWMRGVIDELRKGIQAGWEATRLVANASRVSLSSVQFSSVQFLDHYLELRPGKHHHCDTDTLCSSDLQVWEVVVCEPVTKTILENLTQSILETELTFDVVEVNAF